MAMHDWQIRRGLLAAGAPTGMQVEDISSRPPDCQLTSAEDIVGRPRGVFARAGLRRREWSA
jgi:hypothetical protein